jgi:uracil DNA glycosylase
MLRSNCGAESFLLGLLTEDSWKPLLQAESQKSYWKKLESFLEDELRTKRVYPPSEHIFRALNALPLHEVKVVILGQVWKLPPSLQCSSWDVLEAE